MTPFKVHRLLVGNRHVLPLPKLNASQLRFLAAEIGKRGFAVSERVGALTATSRDFRVHIEQAGYCWCSKDPVDLVVPLVPDLLAFSRERVSAESLAQMYFAEFLAEGVPSVKLRPRLEAASNWERLRASGDCGLTPDERLTAAMLMGSADVAGPVVADFPTDGSFPLILGRRMYFQSIMSGTEAGSTLREVGGRRPRNCYVPKDGVFTSFTPSLATKCATELAEEAGEWCFFEPAA
ncbi:MAG: hypothetical protein JRM74_00925 [Nitrososphaerota archaeon]|nr:hypothetical protein [Nitrososphaerota archaeon]